MASYCEKTYAALQAVGMDADECMSAAIAAHAKQSSKSALARKKEAHAAARAEAAVLAAPPSEAKSLIVAEITADDFVYKTAADGKKSTKIDITATLEAINSKINDDCSLSDTMTEYTSKAEKMFLEKWDAENPEPTETPAKSTKSSTKKAPAAKKPKKVWRSDYDPVFCACRLNTATESNYYGQCERKATEEGGYCSAHTKEYNSKGWFRLGDVRCFGVGAYNNVRYYNSDADKNFLENTV